MHFGGVMMTLCHPLDGLCEPGHSPRGEDYASLVGLGVTSLSGESVFSLNFLK